MISRVWLKCWFTLAHLQGQEHVPCRLMDTGFPKITCDQVYLSERGGLGCAGNESNKAFENPWCPEDLTSFRQSPEQFCLLHSQAWEKLHCDWVMIFLRAVFRWWSPLKITEPKIKSKTQYLVKLSVGSKRLKWGVQIGGGGGQALSFMSFSLAQSSQEGKCCS